MRAARQRGERARAPQAWVRSCARGRPDGFCVNAHNAEEEAQRKNLRGLRRVMRARSYARENARALNRRLFLRA